MRQWDFEIYLFSRKDKYIVLCVHTNMIILRFNIPMSVKKFPDVDVSVEQSSPVHFVGQMQTPTAHVPPFTHGLEAQLCSPQSSPCHSGGQKHTPLAHVPPFAHGRTLQL